MVDCIRCISNRDLNKVKSEAENKHRDFNFGVLTFRHKNIRYKNIRHKNIRYRPYEPLIHSGTRRLSFRI